MLRFLAESRKYHRIDYFSSLMTMENIFSIRNYEAMEDSCYLHLFMKDLITDYGKSNHSFFKSLSAGWETAAVAVWRESEPRDLGRL